MEDGNQTRDGDNTMRVYSGAMGRSILALLCLWALFQIYATTAGEVSAMDLRVVHGLFLLVFTFLLYPSYKKEIRHRQAPPWYDGVLILLSVFSFGYLLLHHSAVAMTGGRLGTVEIMVAAGALFCVFEAARRASGHLALLALLFLSYNFWGAYLPFFIGHNGFTLRRIALSQAWGTEGIFGPGVAVSSTYIFLFVLLGSFLKYSGFARLVNDFALALVGGTVGGPAKVSVLASGVMGMINGSAIANVATTGTITIPLMKKTGYSKEFAAAVEAASSTGGQFTPPIMGAVAFVMAEFLNLSYSYVALAAVTPALLYYAGLLFAVHLEAKKRGLTGISKENRGSVATVLRKEGHMILPLLSLVGLMAVGYTPLRAATLSLFVTILASWCRRETRMTLGRILEALSEGAKNAISVGVCCLTIGVIIGTVTLTSLGLSLGYLILSLVEGHHLLMAGVLVMVMSVILGMGVPGVAAYVIVEAVAVPVLIKAGALPLAAHLFCLLYACLSNITPPVALSAYVASGIAGAKEMKTGWLSMRLGLIGFLIPFFFLGNPVLLMGASSAPLSDTVLAVGSALLGTLSLVAALEGWGIQEIPLWGRLFLSIAALLLLYPGSVTDVVGAALLLVVWFAQQKTRRDI